MKSLVQQHHQAEVSDTKKAALAPPPATAQLKKASAPAAEASAKVRISLSAATLASATEHKATGSLKKAVVFPRATPSKDLLKKVKSKVRPHPRPSLLTALRTTNSTAQLTATAEYEDAKVSLCHSRGRYLFSSFK